MKKEVMPEYKPSVDFYDMKDDFPSMKLGDPVTVVLTGKVMRMSMSGGKYSCCIEYGSAKFLKGTASDKELEAMDMETYAKHRNKEE